MKRMLILLIFFVIIYTVSSQKTFEVNETGKISLAPKVEDPDADRLIYSFTEPLDKNGEWQTTYGDAGEYKVTITVSDGENEVSEDVVVKVNKKEEAPVIGNFAPKAASVSIEEGESLKFSAEVSDLNNDKLSLLWFLDGKFAGEGKEFEYASGFGDSGSHKITFSASDETFNVSLEWNVNVVDVDLEGLLDQVEDISIIETQTARLELPDFKKYGLSYSISDPLSGNRWKTGYEDAGEYTVTVAAEGEGFSAQKDVKIVVENKDRAPRLLHVEGVSVDENQEVKIELVAEDADGDDIMFSAENQPEGASLEGNVFSWTPSFDFVQNVDFFSQVADKFNLLKKSVKVRFIVKSNELEESQIVKITVKDVKRPFVLDEIADVEVDEGKEVMINPTYTHPDNVKVSFSYSGFMNSNSRSTGFEDSGQHTVKVVATDAFHTQTQFVNVNVKEVNRVPVFDDIRDVKVEEGKEVRIELSADDPDNDEIIFSGDLPQGAVIRGNVFIWKPGFGAANGTDKEVVVNFVASDGKEEAIKAGKVIVMNVNKGPKIINASDNLIVKENKATLFAVNAADKDGNELTYEWDFGFFDRFEAGKEVERVFTSPGSKKVEVVVSDGAQSVSKVWNVLVI